MNYNPPLLLNTVQVHSRAEEMKAHLCLLAKTQWTQDEGIKGSFCFFPGNDLYMLNYSFCHLNPTPDKRT